MSEFFEIFWKLSAGLITLFGSLGAIFLFGAYLVDKVDDHFGSNVSMLVALLYVILLLSAIVSALAVFAG